MFTAEFEAKVENGKIAIPDEYRSAFEKQRSIKVILVGNSESMPIDSGEDLIAQLLDQPLAISDLVPAHRDDSYDR
jgi:hypothetical protein